jgi:hypothetical protein
MHGHESQVSPSQSPAMAVTAQNTFAQAGPGRPEPQSCLPRSALGDHLRAIEYELESMALRPVPVRLRDTQASRGIFKYAGIAASEPSHSIYMQDKVLSTYST